MSRTTELRDHAHEQAETLLDALHELQKHVEDHPGENAEDKHAAIRHALDRADRCKRTLTSDWPT